jgi:leucyl aminopeptidase
MELKLAFNQTNPVSTDAHVVIAFSKNVDGKGKKSEQILVNSHWSKELKEAFSKINSNKLFTGSNGQSAIFPLSDGTMVCALGCGEKSKLTKESVRRIMSNLFKKAKDAHTDLSFDIDALIVKKDLNGTIEAMAEAIHMTDYAFDKYLTKKATYKLNTLTLQSKEKKTKQKSAEKSLAAAKIIGDAIAFGRDLVNEPPNVLFSTSYSKIIEKDVKNIKRVKFKALGKAELKKEKMGMFLSVNAGSAHEPRLVHLTYTPTKVTKNTKHIALVGKGLTFDTGGYSLKPGGSMMNMKYDMAGSATMYAAFRAAAMLQPNVKLTCILGMTDNAVNEHATMPDSIVTARNGKTVEILNTDAEGRLVLGDCLDYACDQKPNVVIDAATLTGACLVALGTEVCAVMGNSKKLTSSLIKSSDSVDEKLWELPIIQEWSDDMKSNIADLKNIGSTRFAGTPKAAAFLQEFVQEGIDWAHLDIAGVGDSAKHLPYCPAKGASGIMVRSLVHYMTHA